MKKSEVAELSEAFEEMEGPGAIDEAGSNSAAAGTEALSFLESMAADLLRERVLGVLPSESAGILGSASKSLMMTLRSADLAELWESHWEERWGGGTEKGRKPAEGVNAQTFSHRANLERAWQTLRWGAAGGQEAAPASTPPAKSDGKKGKGGGGGDGGSKGVCGRMPRASTVASSGAVITAPDHTVCAVGLDSSRGNAVTGDCDGLVRLWDIAGYVRAPDAPKARLGVMRVHGKGHAVRWAALHDRRLLVGCAPKQQQAGRLVLIDMDDSSGAASSNQRTNGVASLGYDAACGFLGTGSAPGGNGVKEDVGWVGVDGQLLGLDLELEYDDVRQIRKIPVLCSVSVDRAEDVPSEVCAVVPLRGVCGEEDGSFCGAKRQRAAVAMSFGGVCVVDLAKALAGAEGQESVIRRWEAPAHIASAAAESEGGYAALAAVPAANAIVASWAPHSDQSCTSEQAVGTLRVLDPRAPHASASLDFRSGCPAITALFAPPDVSIPLVLAATASGEVTSFDLRMLGDPSQWKVVVETAVGAGGEGDVQWKPRAGVLAGDGRTLLAVREGGGALVGVLGREGEKLRVGAQGKGEEEGEEEEAWEEERRRKKEEMKEKEKKKKKGSEKAQAVGRKLTRGLQGKGSRGSR